QQRFSQWASVRSFSIRNAPQPSEYLFPLLSEKSFIQFFAQLSYFHDIGFCGQFNCNLVWCSSGFVMPRESCHIASDARIKRPNGGSGCAHDRCTQKRCRVHARRLSGRPISLSPRCLLWLRIASHTTARRETFWLDAEVRSKATFDHV